MNEALLLSAVRLLTFEGSRALTSGSGFWFRREERLFVVTSRHVLIDASSGHLPDRVQFNVHLDREDLTRSATIELPLYTNGRAAWVQGQDSGGEVDVAVLEIACGSGDERAWPWQLGDVFRQRSHRLPTGHRGASGAPVLMRRDDDGSELPWSLLGIHSSRFDMGTRDRLQDDSLGLNCAWYADILTTLTRSRTAANQEW